MKVATIKITDLDRHDSGCECGLCHHVTNRAYGVGIFLVPDDLVYKIKEFAVNNDCWFEYFEDELNDLDPYRVVYAPHDDGAIKDALEFCKEKGFLILKDIINEL